MKRRYAALTMALSLSSLGNLFANDWYQWRGPNRDGIAKETGLLDQWPEEGPAIAYRTKGLGSGMASVANHSGLLYTIGNIDGQTTLECINAGDGAAVWKTPFTADKGAANGTPTIDPETGLVYAMSFDGVMVCCDAKTGKVAWKKSFPGEFSGKMESGWGYSESPLIDGDNLVCTPGASKAMVVALKKKSGQLVWAGKAPEGKLRGNDGAGYSSIVISNAAGRKQYVQLVGHGIVSYDAATGELLWNYDRVANTTANIPTPLVNGNYIFLSLIHISEPTRPY